MENFKSLINQAYQMGKNAFDQNKDGTPHNNKELMAIVPNCAFGDNMGVKLRMEMYKNYIKGWTERNMSQEFDDEISEILNVQVTIEKVGK